MIGIIEFNMQVYPPQEDHSPSLDEEPSSNTAMGVVVRPGKRTSLWCRSSEAIMADDSKLRSCGWHLEQCAYVIHASEPGIPFKQVVSEWW